LQKSDIPVKAAYVYLDPSRSRYYLESRTPSDALHFKKLFGPDRLAVNYSGLRYFFHPTSFSQVNESIVPTMLEQARKLLDPTPSQRLLDLYCGYGLFCHFLSSDYREVIGIDGEGPSIRFARLNCRAGGDSKKVNFIAQRITPHSLDNYLPSSSVPEVVLLDPPRQGPQNGVIEALCRRRPMAVLHVFCGVDQIPESLREWKHYGYEVNRVVPMDMFPGSANLEILILLQPVK
ncbi:class I SAM-dependent RNA methyltransferase, partial [Thermodesulfobacteriota bacterium]